MRSPFWLVPPKDKFRPAWADTVNTIGEWAGWVVDNLGPYADGGSDIASGAFAVVASVPLAEGGHGAGAIACFDAGVTMIAMGVARIVSAAAGDDSLEAVPSTVASITAYVLYGEEAGQAVAGVETLALSRAPSPRAEQAVRLLGVLRGAQQLVEAFWPDGDPGTPAQPGRACDDGTCQDWGPNCCEEARCPYCGACPSDPSEGRYDGGDGCPYCNPDPDPR